MGMWKLKHLKNEREKEAEKAFGSVMSQGRLPVIGSAHSKKTAKPPLSSPAVRQSTRRLSQHQPASSASSSSQPPPGPSFHLLSDSSMTPWRGQVLYESSFSSIPLPPPPPLAPTPPAPRPTPPTPYGGKQARDRRDTGVSRESSSSAGLLHRDSAGEAGSAPRSRRDLAHLPRLPPLRPISNLSFSRSFTFSFFELPLHHSPGSRAERIVLGTILSEQMDVLKSRWWDVYPLVVAMAERKRMAYNVTRDILDEETLEKMAGKADLNPPLCVKLKKSLRASGPKVRKRLLGTVPIMSWLPRYPFKQNALGDLISGISVGIMQLPQGMAYALLASVPPVFGLYSSFYPVLIYFIFGTSKHISTGTYAVMSVMIGSVTERLAPDSNFMIFDNLTNSSMVDLAYRDAERVRVAAAVTCLSGVFQVLLGLLQLGFLVTYLSEPLVRGYTTGAAIHVIVSQLKYTFGINPKRHNGPLSLIYTVLEVCYIIPKTNVGALVVSVVTIVCLILAKELNAYLSKKIPVPIPVELLAIIIATVISWQVNLNEQFGVDVVGKIPSGLQAPVVPAFSLFSQVIGDAFALAFVGYGIAISLGRIFALKYGYSVDSNQEFIALGLSNSIGGFFQCFAISCSMSRTMVQESTGGKTQVAGALSAIVILFITLWIGVLFEDLPKAVLAAIIYVNLHGMMKQFLDVPALWRTNKVDMVVWVVTFILTVLLNPDLGLLASMVFSLVTIIARTQRPKYSRLGWVPHTDVYRPVEEYNKVKEIPGLFIFHSSATLYYANAEMYQEALEKKAGFKINKILSAKKKLDAKRDKFEKKAAKKATKQKPQGREEEPEMGDFAVIDMDYQPDPSLPRVIILDLSVVNFLDTVGVKTLSRIRKEYGQIGIEVLLACCQTEVVDNLQTGGFFNDKVTKSCLFSTVHDAVLHSQTSGMLSHNEENKETYL